MSQAVAQGAIPQLLPTPIAIPTGRRRKAFATAAAVTVHVAVLGLALSIAPPVAPTTPALVLPVALVFHASGGSGRGTLAPATEPASPRAAPVPTAAAARPEPKTVVAARPSARPRPSPAPMPAAASDPGDAGGQRFVSRGGGATGGTAGGNGEAAGSGQGEGGAGFSAASPSYGTNPAPPYPLPARRLGFEGKVVLRVAVAADGRPTDVAVLTSSRFDMLDQAAVETVRTRWRFVPARRDGVAVDDTVEVPIRFRLSTG
jgi:protein TonB